MKYRVERDVFSRHPGFVRAVVVATHARNLGFASELSDQFHTEIQRIEADTLIDEDHPRIKAWRDIYRTFLPTGSKRFQPSVGALVRRIRSGSAQKIPFISPMVCASNLVSLRFLTPGGLVDLDLVTGDLVLGFARGDELFEPISGDLPGGPRTGEVIYFDSSSRNVLCRVWNCKGGRAGMVTEQTSRAVFDIDCLAAYMTTDEIAHATATLEGLLQVHCSARTTVRYLTESSPSFEF